VRRAIVLLVCAAGAAASAGCGDDQPGHYCHASEWGHGLDLQVCAAPIELALRYGDTLRADPALVDYIYVAIRKAYDLDPLFGDPPVRNDGSTTPDRADVHSTYPPLVEHWDRGEVVTGDPTVDAVFADNGAIAVDRFYEGAYGVQLAEPLNPRILTDLAATIPDTSIEQPLPPFDVNRTLDTTLVFVPGKLIAQVRIGWGDCLVGCMGYHTYLLEIPDDGPAELLDDWGDPVPAALLAALRDRPRPP